MTARYDTDVEDVRTNGGATSTEAPRAVRRERVVARRSWSPTWGAGFVLGGLGAIAVVLSIFMVWRDPGAHPDSIPVAFLGDDTTTSTDPSLLIALIPIAVILLVGAIAPMGTAVRLVGGIATLVVVGLFAFQVNESLNGADLGGALGTGWYVATIGGFLAIASGVVPDRWFSRGEPVA